MHPAVGITQLMLFPVLWLPIDTALSAWVPECHCFLDRVTVLDDLLMNTRFYAGVSRINFIRTF